jgi:rod shape-determining protein MreC
MGVAGEITGRLDEKYNGIEYYFQLKRTNDQLVKENLQLRQQLKENFEPADSLRRLIVDTVQTDSGSRVQKYLYLEAKVVGNSVSSLANFLTIHRGSLQQIKPNMGVVSPQGIVGTVINVSSNYSTVMSLLNPQYKVVVKLKKTGERGTVEWDGKNPLYVTLKDIPKSAKVNLGDSVVTSPTSSLFPGNIMVGTISEIVDDKSSNFFTLKLKTATNFYSVEYVYVIENSQYDEQKRLEDSTRKKFQ